MAVSSMFKWVILFLEIGAFICEKDLKLKLITVATDETDGFKRFMRSAKLFDLDVEVFGLNQEWNGGDMAKGPGGGQKLNILREGLKKYKDAEDTVLMFTDSYDVVMNGGKADIMDRFQKTGANILISAEDFIWPDRSLAPKYPKFDLDGYKYLCSGGIIGYAPAVYEIISLKAVNDTDDDQLYYTHIFLDDREKYNIKLDRKATLFQNLHGNAEHVELLFFEGQQNTQVLNKRFQTNPVVIHGNGPSKLFLNYLGNYIPKMWNFNDRCLACAENTLSLKGIPQEDWPTVLIGVYIPVLTPFVDAFLQNVIKLDYPKDKIDLFVHNVYDHHSAEVAAWVETAKSLYKSVTYKDHDAFLTSQQGRNMGLLHWNKMKTDYYLSLDSAVTLSNVNALKILMKQNRTILAPMLSKHQKFWSNFWGDISADGYYARQRDYLDIVKNVRRGVWNSPYISEMYLIHSSVRNQIGADPFSSVEFDGDIKFCANLREKGLFMYVTNLDHFGHLKEMETYTTKQKHNDMYQLFDNKLDWEEKYLHPEFTKYLAEDSDIPQPCPDVYWVPAVTETFAQHLIEECEHFGQWSGGGHQDKRISGGYENVPTVDIHMNQIGFEKHWLHMLKDYFGVMATRIFTGFYSDNKAIMNFVVKYTTNGQYFLRPHHDASTYTVNMALNKRDIEYEGGGARFIRYNCSVPDTKVGWALLHPGRLTHQHEGLPITKGTRYIMVSFVDP